MIETIYIEEEIKRHPRVQRILAKYPKARKILCEKFGEIFNRKSQNFRMQKIKPSLILAKKYGKLLHKTPEGYGIGGKSNYYFSHVLNCPFDCQYCFLQGMFRSSHFVLFINYEDFQKEIAQISKQEKSYFFSGYDGDSLALEPTTRFVEEFLPFFEKIPNAFLEIRTKSIFIRPLLDREKIQNCVVAFSLSPEEIVKKWEKKTPPLSKRLQAIEALQKNGWQIGLRFDPLIYIENFEKIYEKFFQEVFSRVNLDFLHSVTLGAFRLPKTFYQNMQKGGAEKFLLATLSENKNLMAYDEEQKMLNSCKTEILKTLPSQKLFLCS